MELRGVEELMDLLHACRGGGPTADRRGGAAVDPYEHALQTAALLRRGRPADKELQVAGLVLVIGRLLRPGDDTGHADLAADTVRPLLGERVARLVRLHALGADDLVRLHAGGWADATLVEDVLALRHADEAGRTPGMDAGVLEDWRTVLELVADRARAAHHLPGA
ncbi:hypothetical protein ACFZAE_34865 [Streptomyces scabiei]|uniref:hypothetical protein n=1 Tax=Streptomyces TaxID=1883 RepID=UPI001C27B6D6|nr:hypothetical protein [Streptomyces sp. AC495_CC817]